MTITNKITVLSAKVTINLNFFLPPEIISAADFSKFWLPMADAEYFMANFWCKDFRRQHRRWLGGLGIWCP